MNRPCYLRHRRSGLHCHSRFMNQVGGVSSENMHTQDLVGFRVCNDFKKPSRVSGRLCLAQSGIAEPSDVHAAIWILSTCSCLFASLLFGQPDTSNLRQREDAGWDDVIADSTSVPKNIFHRDLSLC